MKTLRTRLERLESAHGHTGPLLVHWTLTSSRKLTACGLTQSDDESAAEFLSRAAAGREGVIWVSDVDADL
jgi:hypothetical protein